MEDNIMTSFEGIEMFDSARESEENSVEFDGNFEPLARERANTWHAGLLYQNEDQGQQSEENSQCATDQGDSEELDTLAPSEFDALPSGMPRKNVTRRNAWGQMSYSDLIVQAIDSSPDQRATLAMIYEWMIKNIPFFRDKGDSNSSAGWKNSIRHNLSLQPRFMRMPNEGTGKSSWWVINHEASSKMLKIPPRRRASTLDTKLYEKRRMRPPKKKTDSPSTPACSLSSLVDDCTADEIPDGFCVPRLDYRCRANSNASSVGRLSPIVALTEDDHLEGLAIMRPIAQQQTSAAAGSAAAWNDIGMDCDDSNAVESSKVSVELQLLRSLSVYDASPIKQTEWNGAATKPSRPFATENIGYNIGPVENGSNTCNKLEPNTPRDDPPTFAGISVQQQHGINRLRSFLSDPATQTMLSSRPELLARVREMIIDKRRRMLTTTPSLAPPSTTAAQFCATLHQQLLTGGGIAPADGSTSLESSYHQYLSSMDNDADISQAIEQAFSLADFNLDQLPYELIADDLLA